jgi:adenosine deaminase
MCQKDNLQFDDLSYIEKSQSIKTDLHSHYTAMLEPEKLIALGLKHNISYPVSHIYALDLDISDRMRESIEQNIVQNYGEDVLSQIQANKGKWKETAEIFTKNKIGMKIPFKNLVIGNPSENKINNLKKILESCSLPKESQNTFTDMKETYANRDPFTNAFGKDFDEKLYNDVLDSKNIPSDIKELFTTMCEDRQSEDFKDNNMQDDMLLWIGRNAREEGIDYIEMSHNALASKNNQKYLDTYNKIMDKVEKETGTRLRMLVGISRTTSYEKYKSNFENIKKSLNSKYVAGIDVLGEETNATERFEKILSSMTKYALNNDPDMVIRVHAGETNSYDANVLKAIEIVYGQYLKKLENSQDISSIKKPNLRIGHGLHGIVEEMQPIDKNSTMGKIIQGLSKFDVFKNKDKLPEDMSLLNFMAEMETIIIERCMSSNILLSHENVLGKEPLKTYIDNGVKCVMGTDGYGVYRYKFSRRSFVCNNRRN